MFLENPYIDIRGVMCICQKKNFQLYQAEEFIAAITQHIPEKSFQMVRYYGWYSSKSRGIRKKQGIQRPDEAPQARPEDEVEIIDVSDYQPRRIPSKKWREGIKKIYQVDPLCCPKCGGEMRIISFITDPPVIGKILQHLDLGKHKPSRDPPGRESSPKGEIVYEPFDDGWSGYEEPSIMVN